ncbi:uncharacterized protein LOC143608024, partial [Bidens hawaiensis]|uniref:uncharacterized protein LOC143608024 n=1 Tax=Bidens hawaiensis TaxID=980011 RepID=UPI004049C01A
NDDQNLSKPEDHTNEEWDIRSSVGMDCTLDNEEEEDSFDKVAVGKEESADRFYMKEINDYEVDIDSTDELPTSFTDVNRDPRANHMAAKLRLKEDDESARKLGLDQIVTESNRQLVMNEPPGSKAAPQSVPDYVRNPSRYTHYTFDSMDDADEGSNRKAYMDLFTSLKGSAAMEIQDDASHTPVMFTPRKKSSGALMKKSKVNGNDGKKAVPVSIANSDEVCMMDEDEPTVKSGSSLQKSGRRYRTKDSADVE